MDLVALSLESVRQRPGMYIGGTGSEGLECFAFEVIGNAFDEHLRGRSRILEVSVHEGWLEVRDDGAGIDLAQEEERIFRTLHFGATLDGHHPHVHVGPTVDGVGVAPVNALSAQFEVVSHREGYRCRAAYARGALVAPVTSERIAGRGTQIRCRPDPLIFEASTFDLQAMETRLRSLATLTPTIDLRFQGVSLQPGTGLVGWVRQLAGPSLEAESILEVKDVVNDIEIDVCLGWRREGRTELKSFVNYNAVVGGSHTAAVLAALCTSNHQVVAGAVGVIHVGLLHPRFAGPTRVMLHMDEVRDAVGIAIRRGLESNDYWRLQEMTRAR